MKRFLKTTLAACASAVVLTASGVASASAATSAPAAGTAAHNSTACNKLEAIESVKIRTSASTGAAALGVFPKGSKSGCLIKSGIKGAVTSSASTPQLPGLTSPTGASRATYPTLASRA